MQILANFGKLRGLRNFSNFIFEVAKYVLLIFTAPAMEIEGFVTILPKLIFISQYDTQFTLSHCIIFLF